MALGNEEILDAIAEMPVKNLVDLVNSICDRFDVSATAAAPVAAVAGAGDAGAVADDGPTSVSVVLTGVGDKKVAVIKVVRAITNLGLKEAKDLVDNAPKAVVEDVDLDKAKEIIAKIEEAGGKAETK